VIKMFGVKNLLRKLFGMKEDVKSSDNLEIVHRKFVADPSGNDFGANDGTKGYYLENIVTAHNLLTDAGRDFLSQQGYYTTGLDSNGGCYIALSSDTNGAGDAHTSLAGEITNNGLGRAIGTVAHNNGENTTTIQKTFTATDTHTAVQLCGLFSASTAGTLVHEATFTSATLENNDQLQMTWTITLDD